MNEISVERFEKLERNIECIKMMLAQMTGKQISTPNTDNESGLMSVKQLRDFLNLDCNIIYSKCSKGEIPYVKIGKHYRFKKEEIMKWVKSKKRESDFSVDDYVDSYLQKNLLKG